MNKIQKLFHLGQARLVWYIFYGLDFIFSFVSGLITYLGKILFPILRCNGIYMLLLEVDQSNSNPPPSNTTHLFFFS